MEDICVIKISANIVVNGKRINKYSIKKMYISMYIFVAHDKFVD